MYVIYVYDYRHVNTRAQYCYYAKITFLVIKVVINLIIGFNRQGFFYCVLYKEDRDFIKLVYDFVNNLALMFFDLRYISNRDICDLDLLKA